MTNNAPTDNPQPVTWTTTDPQVISRFFFGDQQTGVFPGDRCANVSLLLCEPGFAA